MSGGASAPSFKPQGLRLCPALSPISEQISRRQSQVDRLYVALKELGEERRVGLEQQYWLYQLSRQVDELEHWIAEKEVVAGSPELGQDFEHVTVSNDNHASGYCVCYRGPLGLSFSICNTRIITALTSSLCCETNELIYSSPPYPRGIRSKIPVDA